MKLVKQKLQKVYESTEAKQNEYDMYNKIYKMYYTLCTHKINTFSSK